MGQWQMENAVAADAHHVHWAGHNVTQLGAGFVAKGETDGCSTPCAAVLPIW
jgi:hypothetical protein